MNSIYKNADPERCKASIYGHWSRSHQCLNKPKKDGWCMTHHPDKVAEREAKIAAKREHEYSIRQTGYNINSIDRKIVLAALDWARCGGDDEGVAICGLADKRNELTEQLKTLEDSK